MAKILMISHSHFPDKRINQEAEFLVKENHEIHLICGKQTHTEKTQSIYKSITVIPLTRNQQAFLSIPVRKAAKKYKKRINEIKPDLIHAHDLMAANIIRLVIPKETKFIFDDHEIMELKRKFRAHRSPNIVQKIIRYIIYLLSIRARKKVMKKANTTIVVNSYFIDYYKRKGEDQKKIMVLENFPKKEYIAKALAQKDLVDEFFLKDPRKKLVYSSSIVMSDRDLERSITNFIQAVSKLDDWVMVIFSPEIKEYESKGVRFIQRKPLLEYLASIAHSDVSVNATLQDERLDHSSPNRIFESALLGVRIISNKVSSIYEKFGDKIIWLENEKIPADQIVEILKNIEKYPAGKELQKCAEDFVWEKQISKLIERYAELLKEK